MHWMPAVCAHLCSASVFVRPTKVRSIAGAHFSCILCALQVDSPWLLVFVDVDELSRQLTTAGQKCCLRRLTFAAFDEFDIGNRQA